LSVFASVQIKGKKMISKAKILLKGSLEQKKIVLKSILMELNEQSATSQFKNQYVMQAIKTFESKYKIKIIWHFYAPLHGKPVVDGIGGTVKRYVRNRIIAENLLVKSAKDFADICTGMDINVIHVSPSDIQARNKAIQYDKIIKESSSVTNIKKNHCFEVKEVKVGRKMVQKVIGHHVSPF